ncbi:hypothetical protein LCGC14_1513670 [marine sediment metagenome]|uniref:Uncharacterized protein n=1 Tax=marine sediment metagenome TaxID=412755 RepID=A0A0F9J0Q4_9ZZZZ
MIKKIRIRLASKEAARVNEVASAMVDKIIAGETLRLTLPIVRLMLEKTIVAYKRIESRYGEVI